MFEHFESKEALFHEAVVLPLLDAMRGMHRRAQAYEAAHSLEEMQALAQDSAKRNFENMASMFPLLTAALFSDMEPRQALRRADPADPAAACRRAGGVLKDGLDPEFVELALFGIFSLWPWTRRCGAAQGSARLAEQITNCDDRVRQGAPQRLRRRIEGNG